MSRPPPLTGGAATGASPSEGVAQVTETSLSKGSQEAATMFKNVKPLVFQGEEKDHNKDAVTTFLQKWRDLHRLRHTLDLVATVEASLSLEGKAYKWWLSIDEHARPTTWGEFEVMFHREFLLANEKDHNWNAWDQCKMDNITLIHYISKYQAMILKLEGLDDFQKVCGFIRGLHKDYQAKVRTQYPKTLEEAIKSAHIFDDSINKKGFGKTSWEDKSHNSYAKGSKRKISQSLVDSSQNPKGGHGPLTREEFERGKNEILHFHCLGTHEKKDCPQLKHKDAEKGKGKEKALYMVQVMDDECVKCSALTVYLFSQNVFWTNMLQ